MRSAAAGTCAALVAVLMTSTGAQVAFDDVTAAAGLDAPLRHDKPAGGIGVADYNRDGWPDLFLPATSNRTSST